MIRFTQRNRSYLLQLNHLFVNSIFKRLISIVIFSAVAVHVHAQKQVRIGFDLGLGTQQVFPFNDPVYFRNTTGFKMQIYYPFRTARFSYELLIEPSFYLARQQLLDKDYVTELDYGPDYLALREIYSQMRTINEYALNLGFVTRYNFNSSFSSFFLISVGPFYGNKGTERLAKGFAFSDILAIGAGYTTGRLRIEFRTGVRHVSNLNIQYPNKGHNTSTIDLGITYSLKNRS